MKKITYAVLLALLAVFAFATYATASAVEPEYVSVYVDGAPLYEYQPLLINDTTYIPFAALTEHVDDSILESDGEIFAFTTPNISVYTENGSNVITVNGRYFYSPSPNLVINGQLHVPLRSAVQSLGATFEWVTAESAAYITLGDCTVTSGDEFYNSDEVYWLSRIINAESRGEPLEGKIAVGNVVQNRVESKYFPNTIYDVIFDRQNGVQFTPISNGSIYYEPTEESVIAAKICLEGFTLSDSIYYFIAEAKASSKWVVYNCSFVMSIGNHDFYS